eukprot:s61_g40.t1
MVLMLVLDVLMAVMAELGDFFSAELQHLSSLDGPNAVMVKRGLQLPTGLPEASGYFLRVFFYDAGGSCCSAVSTNPLFADSEDFSLEGQELLVKEALELTSEDISGGRWEDAFARVSDTCATTATPSSWIACETAKALQLGLPVGQRALVCREKAEKRREPRCVCPGWGSSAINIGSGAPLRGTVTTKSGGYTW